MRLWSFNPGYLDSKGLIAVWREGLLAQKVLLGKTKGYVNHPQLIRFKAQKNPCEFIAAYLHYIYCEAKKRDYRFNALKIISAYTEKKITCTKGQLYYEWTHFKNKIKRRDQDHYQKIKSITIITPHPLFVIIPGEKEEWDRSG